MHPAIWHGTPDELARLEAALQRHCTCATTRAETHQEVCPAHALLSDARLLDHLVYVYRTRARFERGEWSVQRSG